MRLGLLGPSHGDVATLEKAARLLLVERAADLVIYLGPDDALDRLVLQWATRLVGEDPTESGIWRRASTQCSAASPNEIDRFLQAESQRDRLKALRCLPGASSRTVELLDGHVTVLLYDKALLDEEDILPATLLVYGKSSEPLIRQVGTRTFVSPGELGRGTAGAALLSTHALGHIDVAIFNVDGAVVRTHTIPAASRGGVLRVQGAGSPGGPT